MTALKLASALDEVPDVLLDVESRETRDAALASLHALATSHADPSVLVVIGGGGSGKSSIVNALVGSDIAAVSAVRPTTVGVTVIGKSNHSALGGSADYTYTDLLRDGVAVVDTPSWDHERDAVLAVAAVAHTVVVVLTPARYGDSAASEVVRGLPDRSNVLIVANRMPVDPAENDDVLDDIESTFDQIVHTQVVEGEAIELVASLVADLPVDTNALAEKRSSERAAARLGRSLARGVSAAAADLGDVQRALAATTPIPADPHIASPIDDWPVARSALIDDAQDIVAAFDDAVVDRSGNDLAVRIRGGLSAPDRNAMGSALDTWRTDTAGAFRLRAKPRWRRNTTLDLCGRWSWMLSIDQRVQPPRRVSRAMRGTLDAAVSDARVGLLSILDAGTQHRQTQWAEFVLRAGSYQPGELFAAANALDGGEAADE